MRAPTGWFRPREHGRPRPGTGTGPGSRQARPGAVEGSAKTRPPSKRAIPDAAATEKIAKVHQQNKSVCDLLTVWADLRGKAVGDRYTHWRIM